MPSQDLIEKLNNLKHITPDSEWKARNRDVLFSQISNAVGQATKGNFIILTWSQRAVKIVSQPVWATAFVFLIIIGIFSVGIIFTTEPGDSLYIAKVVSEKAQLAITFNEDKKSRLGLKFASDRAKVITQLLANSDSGDESENERTAKLIKDFKKEISIVKNNLRNIALVPELEPEPATDNDEEAQVFSANLGKDDKGMKISEPASKMKEDLSAQAGKITEKTVATTTDEGTPDESSGLDEAQRILDEAEALFDNKEYDGIWDKLEEVDDIVEASGKAGDVKGIMEEGQNDATSTESTLE